MMFRLKRRFRNKCHQFRYLLLEENADRQQREILECNNQFGIHLYNHENIFCGTINYQILKPRYEIPIVHFMPSHFKCYKFQRYFQHSNMLSNTASTTVWQENNPDSLEDICIRYILRHPSILFYAIEVSKSEDSTKEHDEQVCVTSPKLSEWKTHSINYNKLKGNHSGHNDLLNNHHSPSTNHSQSNIHLRLHPHIDEKKYLCIEGICEKIFEILHHEGYELNDCVLVAFGNPANTRLRRLQLRNSTLSDNGLKKLLKHKIRSLDVSGCSNLTEKSLDEINQYCCDALLELKVSGNTNSEFEDDYKEVIDNSILPMGISCSSRGDVDSVTEQDHSTRLKSQNPFCQAEELVKKGKTLEDIKKLIKLQHQKAQSNSSLTNVIDNEIEDEMLDERLKDESSERQYILNTPQLQSLCIHNLEVKEGLSYYPILFKNLTNLTHLDMSGCSHREGMEECFWLPKYLKNSLISLIFHNVKEISLGTISNIIKLNKLRHLDISQHPDNADDFYYEDPNKVLKSIVENLPELKSLDISATNLAGNGVFEYDSSQHSQNSQNNDRSKLAERARDNESNNMDVDQTMDTVEMPQCDIVGLISRIKNPLDFLGLYKCSYQPNHRTHIPARRISGDKDEAQLLLAGRQYLNRPSYLSQILLDICKILQNLTYKDFRPHLDIVLLSMNRYIEERNIQFAGSACLYYIVRGNPEEYDRRLNEINLKMKERIIGTLINAMFYHKDEDNMLRNGLVTLNNVFEVQNLICDYERLVRILLYIVATHKHSTGNFNVQAAAIRLFNSLACQVEGHRKLLIGDLGAIEQMLNIIQEKLRARNCDEVLESAWSTMWNVTDETPINCERFLNGRGMELFLRCKEEFPDSHDLLRNMMGLLGNVAEVKNLRPKLMTEAFVSEFATLLDSNMDGIEVSYNAAGVLSHIVSDGPEAWTIEEPRRQDVLARMVRAIESWSLDTKRNINYRSFEPILRLVRVNNTPECQHWAVWALANLTNVDAEKYCSLVENEGGIIYLEELINSNIPLLPYEKVIDLASVVRSNVTKWKERKKSSKDLRSLLDSGCHSGDENSDNGLDLDG